MKFIAIIFALLVTVDLTRLRTTHHKKQDISIILT